MPQTFGTDRITRLLTTYLDAQSRRAEVTSANIANAETPGYKARQLDFADHLARAAQTAVSPARDGLTRADEQPRVTFQLGNPERLDGNNVDTGREMAELAEAGKEYLTGVQLLQSRLRTLRAAIREGR